MHELLIAALAAMPQEFTSNAFCAKARALGFKEKDFYAATSQFLKNNCRQLEVKTWQKPEDQQEQPKQTELFTLNEEICVKFLKGLGNYKIMKLVEI